MRKSPVSVICLFKIVHVEENYDVIASDANQNQKCVGDPAKSKAWSIRAVAQ